MSEYLDRAIRHADNIKRNRTLIQECSERRETSKAVIATSRNAVLVMKTALEGIYASSEECLEASRRQISAEQITRYNRASLKETSVPAAEQKKVVLRYRILASHQGAPIGFPPV